MGGGGGVVHHMVLFIKHVVLTLKSLDGNHVVLPFK